MGSSPDNDIRDLILRLYDTVLAPESWPLVLQRVAESLGGAGVIIFERPRDQADQRVRASLMSAAYNARAIEAYLSRFADHEQDDQILFEQTSMLRDNVELVSDDSISHAGAPLSRRPNARFLRAFGLRHRAAALLDKDDPSRDRFSVQFAATRGPATPGEFERARTILPHLAKALAIARLVGDLDERRKIALHALDRLRIGVAITDRAGRPVFENTAFRRIAEDGGAIGCDRSGKLAIRETRSHARLMTLLGDVGGHGHFGARPRKEAVIVGRDDEAASGVCVEVCPLGRVDEVSSTPFNGYLVTCLDTDAAFDLDVSVMSRRFHLSAAEERVLGQVTVGHSNAEIAAFSSRSVETVNSQVKALLAKTGCENRTQLVRLTIAFGQRLTSGDARP